MNAGEFHQVENPQKIRALFSIGDTKAVILLLIAGGPVEEIFHRFAG